jgi:xanthine dehydrogenase molybdopterin-binding subunit B
MAVIETIMDRIARLLGKDPLEVRRKNFYRDTPCNTTHYGQVVEENRLAVIVDRLLSTSEYAVRRAAVGRFNAEHEFQKRGLALTPVKFGISFTTTFLNQAAALVHIYTDGTVLVSHGGVEMGQGLHTKIRGIAAAELGIDPVHVRVGPTNTATVPNTSATAASSGADLNGMAVKNAIDVIKLRMAEGLAARFSSLSTSGTTLARDIIFAHDAVYDSGHPDRTMSFAAAVQYLYLQRVSLSAAGFFSTPGIGWDREAGRGNPFRYFAFGMAVSEVLVDLLTGEHTLERVDILHDVGDSLNPAIDRGQIEGGFVQGAGWCTTEEVLWDVRGNLLTHSPDTYKIPTAGDVPEDFRVALLEGAPNTGAIRNSKAVGEPPFMLALSVWLAIKDALSAITGHQEEPRFNLPATRERIVLEAERLRALTGTAAPGGHRS